MATFVTSAAVFACESNAFAAAPIGTRRTNRCIARRAATQGPVAEAKTYPGFQPSLSVTARLNTNAPGFESTRSAVK
jgi:hypothetical protein